MPHAVPPEAFTEAFVRTYEREFGRLRRILDRSAGDGALADDLAQEAFVRLFRRGALPDAPASWLVSVALNLLRNDRAKARRRRLILERERPEAREPGTSGPPGVEARDEAARVRALVDGLAERDRDLLLLRAEGYGYGEIAAALDLNPASVGTLLARARRAFRAAYEEASHASR